MSVKEPAALGEAVVATLYGSPFSDAPWRDAVELLCDHLDAVLMVLSFRLGQSGAPTISVRAVRDNGERIWDGFHARHGNTVTFDFDRLAPGQIHAMSELRDRGDEGSERLWRDLLGPEGIGEVYSLPIGRSDTIFAHLTWLKKTGHPVVASERRWCAAVMPHLDRALDAYQRMRQAELASQLAGGALSHASIGVLALDHEDRIVFINEIAERIVGNSPDLRQRNGRLAAVRADLSAMLEASRHGQQVTRIRAQDEEPIDILMIPVEGDDELGPGSRPERALYFHAMAAPTLLSASLIERLFDLSHMEARLSVLLAEGSTLREAAGHLGITESSARTYSKRIFAKLGVSRQVDLVRMLLRGVAIFGEHESR
jgi:DNA-binding CsgD family transcriptional regulator/PAS domain-containing protein